MKEWRNRIIATGDEAPDQLLANPKNFRRHPKHQQEALRGVLNEVGWVQDVIVNRTTGRLVDGHLRVELALRDGATTVPVKYVELSDAEESLILATFDPISALATADKEQLDALLREVSTGEAGVQQMLADLAEREGISIEQEFTAVHDIPDAADDIPDAVEAVTKRGDIWRLGSHRVMCGDSTSPADVAALMDGREASFVFTSPPYLQQRDYGGNLPPWDQLMQGVFYVLPVTDDAQLLVNLGLVYRESNWIDYWHDWIAWMRTRGYRQFGWYVWDQGNGMPGDWRGRLGPSHEFIFHFNKTAERARKSVESKHGGKPRTGNGQRRADGIIKPYAHGTAPIQETKIHDSVFRIARQQAHGIHEGHPATYPVRLVTEVWECFTDPGDLGYDPFLGSGTSVIGAEQIGRVCCGMEIEPTYLDIVIERWEQVTGISAIRESRADAAD